MLPDRYQQLARELAAFGTAGVINTLLGTLIFNLLLGAGALTATTISTAVATLSSYLMNRHLTYRHRPRTTLRRELPMFVGFNVMALGLRLGIMAGAKVAFALDTHDRLEMNVVNAVGIVAGTIFLLVTYRTFVFKPEPVTVGVAPVASVAVMVTQPAASFAELTHDLVVELNEILVADEAPSVAVASTN
jgi:putative flippase GtrA